MTKAIVKTSAFNAQIAAMIKANGSKFFSVTFVNKAGEERTIQGRVFKDPLHKGENNAAHFQKYVLVVARGRDEQGKRKFRNVNLETVKRLAISGEVVTFNR